LHLYCFCPLSNVLVWSNSYGSLPTITIRKGQFSVSSLPGARMHYLSSCTSSDTRKKLYNGLVFFGGNGMLYSKQCFAFLLHFLRQVLLSVSWFVLKCCCCYLFQLLNVPKDKLKEPGPLQKKYKRLLNVWLLLGSSLMKLDEALMLFHDFWIQIFRIIIMIFFIKRMTNLIF